MSFKSPAANPPVEVKGEKVTKEQIEAAIVREEYKVFPDTTFTLCLLKLKNGFIVHGVSACVDKNLFDIAEGERLAREKAIDTCWELFGFQLASELTGFKVRYIGEESDA